MEIMKNKKIIAINLIIIILFNIFSTLIYSVLATEDTNDENINKLKDTNETSDIINFDNIDDNLKNENIECIDELENDENKYETIKEEKEDIDKIIVEDTENEQINTDTVEQKENQENEQKQDNNIQQIEQIQEEDKQVINTEKDINYVNKKIEVEEKNLNNEEIKSSNYEEFSLYVKINEYKVNTYITDNIYYLFIPQGADLSNLIINYTGNITNVSTGTLDINNKIILNDFSHNDTLIIMENNIEHTIKVMQSNLPSISISLNGTTLNEINNGSKDIKYKNNSLVLNTLNKKEYDFNDDNVEIKGRGNFSWILPKKSYQVKLSKKQNVLGMEKAKTWLLIANYADCSLMRNKLVYDLAKDISMPYSQNSEYVDLWIDGEFQGNYLLTEKVQINDNRVELKDTEGLIVEMDNNYYADELNWFESNISKSHFVLKDSVSDDEGQEGSLAENSFNKFKNHINKFEEYLYSNNKDWNKISSLINVESFVKYYFIQEFTENADGCRTSMFMYKDGDRDLLHMGPVWDFDLALANCDKDNWGGNPQVDYIININKNMEYSLNWYAELFKIPEFRQEVIKIYNKELNNTIKNSMQMISNYKSELNKS